MNLAAVLTYAALPPISLQAAIGIAALAVLSIVLLWIIVRSRPTGAFLFIMIVLVATGSVLIFVPVPHFNDEFRAQLGDALIIASILALTVDWYLKDRVLREISSDVSKYLVGYRLPEQVQDRIRWLMQTQWIRRNYVVRCRLTEIHGKEGQIKLEVIISNEVQNITAEAQSYQHLIEYEKYFPQTFTEVRCDSEDPKAKFRLAAGQIQVKEKADEPGVMSIIVKRIKIPPVHESIGRSYRFTSRYEVEHPTPYSDIVSFALPTIGVTIEVECPANYRFTVGGADLVAHNRWEFKRLFLPGENVRFRWEKIDEAEA